MKFTLVDLLLLMMICFWGGNLTIIKVALKHFDPVAFNCLRFLIASVTMLILYRDVFRDKVNRRDLWLMLGLGVLGNTFYQFLFIYGVAFTHVSHVAILLGVTPIFTAGISSVLGFERVGRLVWFGIVLSFSGVILIVFGGGSLQAGNTQSIIGDVFIFLASVSWACYTTFSQDVIRRYSSRHYILYTILFGTLFLTPLSIPALLRQNWQALGLFEWGALLYSALLALVFGYSAWYYSVQHVGSTRTAIYSNLTPVAGLVVGMVFLHERLAALQWAGAAVIFCGLMLNRITRIKVVQPE